MPWYVIPLLLHGYLIRKDLDTLAYDKVLRNFLKHNQSSERIHVYNVLNHMDEPLHAGTELLRTCYTSNYIVYLQG